MKDSTLVLFGYFVNLLLLSKMLEYINANALDVLFWLSIGFLFFTGLNEYKGIFDESNKFNKPDKRKSR